MRIRTAAAALVAVVAAACVGGYAAWHAIAPKLPAVLPGLRPCVVTAEGEVNLNLDQMANAATIAAVGLRRGLPTRAVVVALATARQESKLLNLPGGDRDSLGLFQQRPSMGWGTEEQLADPRYAANAFYTALLKVPGWQDMRVTDAAQAVQHSATPEAYEQWADDATVLSRALAGAAAGAVACAVNAQPELRGAAAANALVSEMKLDWGDLGVTRSNDVVGIDVTVTDPRTGWRYANWLVSQAGERSITRVLFAGQEWTAKRGKWAPASDGTLGRDERVVAEVYT